MIGAVAAVWNYAVELARGVVQAVVTELTRPVFDLLKVVAAGLGAASVLLSYLKGTALEVAQEDDLYRLAVGAEPDVRGRIVAKARDLSRDWPPALIDCVGMAGERMPELMEPGAMARWRLDDSVIRPGLILPASLQSTVASDHRAYLDFVTDRETEEEARGTPAEAGPLVSVEVEQKAVTDFLRRTEQRAVVLQLERLMDYPMVRRRVVEGQISLHGWHYVIEEGEVHVFDVESGRFVAASVATHSGTGPYHPYVEHDGQVLSDENP